MKKVFVLLLALIGFNFANAQKIAYCEVEKIIAIMPETEKAKAQYEKEVADFQKMLEEKQVEYNQKLQEYQKNMELPDDDPNKWPDYIRADKEKEIMSLQQRIYEFQMDGQERLQQRLTELLQPIYDKVDSVLNEVAKEKGYSIIFKDMTFVFINKDKCDDVTPYVKQKLGLQ